MEKLLILAQQVGGGLLGPFQGFSWRGAPGQGRLDGVVECLADPAGLMGGQLCRGKLQLVSGDGGLGEILDIVFQGFRLSGSGAR